MADAGGQARDQAAGGGAQPRADRDRVPLAARLRGRRASSGGGSSRSSSGTFMLVLVGAGAAFVDARSHGAIGRDAAVVSPGPDGARDHPLHGRRLGRPPQPGGDDQLHAARRLPAGPRARLHRRPARRRDARGALPEGGLRLGRRPRRDRARARHPRLAGDADRGGADARPRQHDPRDGVAGAERRRAVGGRGRRLHRARRACGRARSAAR